MAALAIAQATITNPEKFQNYGPLATKAVQKIEGRLLARSPDSTILKREWPAGMVVVVEFESLKRAPEWQDSPEYREAIEARKGAATFHMIALEGG